MYGAHRAGGRFRLGRTVTHRGTPGKAGDPRVAPAVIVAGIVHQVHDTLHRD